MRAVRTGERHIERRSPGRPIGEVAESILEALREHPRTVRQLALKLKCAVPVVDESCRRLRAAERIKVAELVRVEGSNRRVAVYQIAEDGSDAIPAPSLLFGGRHGRR
ncbi:hypothetical protein ACFOEY_19605 [Paracandidimonas soli]|uniref:hypothetical protein n=1 Tax=Paracandidimonas soli TaxID=1917182 RepID=UPI003610BFA0